MLGGRVLNAIVENKIKSKEHYMYGGSITGPGRRQAVAGWGPGTRGTGGSGNRSNT
jgi:hypothetical protein